MPHLNLPDVRPVEAPPAEPSPAYGDRECPSQFRQNDSVTVAYLSPEAQLAALPKLTPPQTDDQAQGVACCSGPVTAGGVIDVWATLLAAIAQKAVVHTGLEKAD